MDSNIEQKICSLPPEIQEKFRKDLIDVCEDRFWLRDHGMIYSAPDVEKIKSILFKEEYEPYLISNRSH